MSEYALYFKRGLIPGILASWRQLLVDIHIKALVACAGTFYVHKLGGNILILQVWAIFMLVDLMTGIAAARRKGGYNPKRVGFWAYKAFGHLLLFLLCGLLARSFGELSGKVYAAMNWLIFCCIVTEAASILDNCGTAKVPIPAILPVGLKLFRRYTARRIANALGGGEDPRILKEIEDALASKGMRIVKFRAEDEADGGAENKTD